MSEKEKVRLVLEDLEAYDDEGHPTRKTVFRVVGEEVHIRYYYWEPVWEGSKKTVNGKWEVDQEAGAEVRLATLVWLMERLDEKECRND